MRTAALLLLLLASSAAAHAQSLSRNAAYAELGGNAVILSLNYERRLSEHVYGRIGFSPIDSSNDSGDHDVTYVFPLLASYVTHPASNHHFEAGGGVTFVTGDSQSFFDDVDNKERNSKAAATAVIGYRYQKPGRGFLFRSGITPLYVDGDLLPWLGVSFGYAW